MSIRFSNPYWLWLSAVVIVVDQLTKQQIFRTIEWFGVRPVTDFLNIVHMRNTGAAFSSFSHLPPWAFAVLGVGVSIGILVWLRRNPHQQPLVAVALCLILGGAIGNVIDRVMRGYVIDFIDFHIGDWHYAAFNVADIAISIGAGLLILDMILDWLRSRREAGGSAADEGSST